MKNWKREAVILAFHSVLAMAAGLCATGMGYSSTMGTTAGREVLGQASRRFIHVGDDGPEAVYRIATAVYYVDGTLSQTLWGITGFVVSWWIGMRGVNRFFDRLERQVPPE